MTKTDEMDGPYTEKYRAALSKLGTLPPDAPQGVLDIGSNSVRLVGYSGSARSPLPIYNERAFCRLGDSVSLSGRIEGRPRDLAMQTFHRFRAIAEQLGIENFAAFATAAVREAENSAAFIAEAEQVLGHKIRVLSGEEEARLSADGVMLGIPGADGIVADLGGGSLELARVRDNQTHEWVSLPLGVLALAQSDGGDMTRMATHIAAVLDDIAWVVSGKDLPLYIVGGTWRSLAKLHMDKHDYPLEVLHQYSVSASDMTDFCGDISAGRVDTSTAPSNRREALPIAALILEKLEKMIRPSQIIVSANAVREGILYAELKAKYRRLDPLLLGCEEMAERMCKSAAYGHELAVWTDALFRHAEPKGFALDELNRLRQAGCLISDLAWAHHASFRAATVGKTVLTAPFIGISHEGRVFLAHALGFRHDAQGVASDYGRLALAKEDYRLARAFGLSLRLAHSLSASLPGVLPHTRLKAGRNKLSLTLAPSHETLIGPIIEKRLRAAAQAMGLQPSLKHGTLDEH